ncbi:telomere repeat binding factor-domain-containing protein [Xylariales sp. AK1849]|nr:telomere repeat binding factor-domain-containing protein [Xylariales sp. AK1849]
MIQKAQDSVTGHEAQEDHTMPNLNVNGEISGTLDHGTNDIVNDIMASLSHIPDSGINGNDHGHMHHHHGADAGAHPSDLFALPPTASKTTLWSNPIRYTRQTHALPTLGKVAVDIIRTLSENSLEDTIATLNDEESEIAKEYGTLSTFFDTLRKSFSDNFPLLYADQLDITSTEDQEVIRIANLATTCASMFGANELGWPDLNTDFLLIFVPNGQQMPADVAELYIGLKTQMFLTLLESEQKLTREQLLEELFVFGQEEALNNHHPGLPLATSETEFLANAEARKAMLLNESGDPNNILPLTHQYTYEAYLDSLSAYLNDNIAAIESIGTGRTSPAIAVESTHVFDGTTGNLDGMFDLNAAIAEASKAAQSAMGNGGDTDSLHTFLEENISQAAQQSREQTGNPELPSAVLSATESATRGTSLALQTIQRNQYHSTADPQQSYRLPNAAQPHSSYPSQQIPVQQQYLPYPQQQNASMQSTYQTPIGNETLPPNQSVTTEMLYEKARLMAAAKSNTHARREGSHSTRRPWSPDEEKALMMGLDMVKGPHWSQILTLFGAHGSINNVLAERTQVQLKDKARNLKLFFLKAESEMPYYLHCVTGELKTRAPSQAARKERAKINSEEDQARINGILTLGNMQNGTPQTPDATPNTQAAPTPNPALSHSHAHPGSPQVSQLQRAPSSQKPTQTTTIPGLPVPQPVHLPRAVSCAPEGTPQPQQHAQTLNQAPQQTPPHRPQAELQHQQQQQKQQQQQQPTAHQEPQSQSQQLRAPPQAEPQLQLHVEQSATRNRASVCSKCSSANLVGQGSNSIATDCEKCHGNGVEASEAPRHPKVDESISEPKHEPLNEEEAALLNLKSLIDQESAAAISSAPTTES